MNPKDTENELIAKLHAVMQTDSLRLTTAMGVSRTPLSDPRSHGSNQMADRYNKPISFVFV
jgi:hypothetical protein